MSPIGRWVISPHSAKLCLLCSQLQGPLNLMAVWTSCLSCSGRNTYYLPYILWAAGTALGPSQPRASLHYSISSGSKGNANQSGGTGHLYSQIPQMNWDSMNTPHPPGLSLLKAGFLETYLHKTYPPWFSSAFLLTHSWETLSIFSFVTYLSCSCLDNPVSTQS